jgi:hypothetical protein
VSELAAARVERHRGQKSREKALLLLLLLQKAATLLRLRADEASAEVTRMAAMRGEVREQAARITKELSYIPKAAAELGGSWLRSTHPLHPIEGRHTRQDEGGTGHSAEFRCRRRRERGLIQCTVAHWAELQGGIGVWLLFCR